MEIKTKMSIGDEAWFMENNAAISLSVEKIIIEVEPDGLYRVPQTKITYYLGRGTINRPEDSVFASKADLLSSL